MAAPKVVRVVSTVAKIVRNPAVQKGAAVVAAEGIHKYVNPWEIFLIFDVGGWGAAGAILSGETNPSKIAGATVSGMASGIATLPLQ